MPDQQHTTEEQHTEGGPWTSHGHPVPGITVVPEPPATRPPVARCGGPALCRQCSVDAERIRAERAGAEEQRAARIAELERLGALIDRVTADAPEIFRHPLHRVIVAAVIGHTTVRTPTGPITACQCGGLRLGESWSDHLAGLVLAAVLDNSLQILEGRFVIVPALGEDGDPPRLTSTPPFPTLHDGDRVSVEDAEGKGVTGYVASWTTAPGGDPFVILCTSERPGFPPPKRRHVPLCGAHRGEDCTCNEVAG